MTDHQEIPLTETHHCSCGESDTGEFVAAKMCCACKGAETEDSPVCNRSMG